MSILYHRFIFYTIRYCLASAFIFSFLITLSCHKAISKFLLIHLQHLTFSRFSVKVISSALRNKAILSLIKKDQKEDLGEVKNAGYRIFGKKCEIIS